MKTFKIKVLSLMVIFSVTSCSASPKDSSTTEVSTNTITASSSVKEQMQSAKAGKQNVLMVVRDKESSIEKILGIVNDVAKSTTDIKVVEMDMSDEKNADLVKEYRLSGAPAPLVLLFSNTGVLLGGMVEAQITKEALADAIPTPKYSEILGSLSQGTPVFAVVSNGKFKSDKSARELCESAKKEMAGKAEIVVVDAEDTKESKLITMLNIKNKLDDSFIIAINGQGIMAGRFDAIPTKADLIAAATKVVQSGCAPGGCGPTCN